MRTSVAIIYLTKAKAMPRNKAHDGLAADLESAGAGAHPVGTAETGDPDARSAGRSALTEGSRAASPGDYAADDRDAAEASREDDDEEAEEEVTPEVTYGTLTPYPATERCPNRVDALMLAQIRRMVVGRSAGRKQWNRTPFSNSTLGSGNPEPPTVWSGLRYW